MASGYIRECNSMKTNLICLTTDMQDSRIKLIKVVQLDPISNLEFGLSADLQKGRKQLQR